MRFIPSSAALALLLLATTAWASPFPAGLISFRRVPIPDDVPAHLCTALAQDREGFLWIGTQAGLIRYDGYSFRLHRSDPEDQHTLGSNYVRTLLAASDGRLWAGTFSGGLSAYDPATETFTRYRQVHDRVEGLAEDRSGRIWVATYEGLDRLDPRTGHIDHFLAGDRVRSVLVDGKGQVWAGGRDGLQIWREGKGFERVAPELAGQFVGKLFEDSRGRIWIGTTENGAAVFDPRTGKLRRLQGLSHFWVYGIAQAKPGEIWIATFGGGVDVVDPDSLEVLDRLRHDPALENTVGGDRIGALLVDRSGMMWVGTWGQGIVRHDPAARAFRALRHAAAVRALEMQDGSIWVGTNGNGIDILDRAGRRIGSHRPDPGALSDGSVTCLAQGRDGAIWVATLNGALHRWKYGAFERLTGLPGGPIRAMTFGPDGALWVGAAEGLGRIDPRSLETSISLSGHAVEAIAFAQGTLWVGTDSGLDAFDPKRGTATRITGLPDNWVPDLLTDRDGRLWVATPGGAAILKSWDGRNARFETVAARLGRPPAPVESLIQDAQGQVWLGPRLRVDPRTWTWRELGPADGCDFRSFFIASRSRTADGTLLFGSPEGLLMVRPEQIAPWTYAPPVVATALRVDGVERPGAARLSRLILYPGERGFRLDFAALDFTAPQRNGYRYRLEGFDPGWNPADAAQRSLGYTSLPPGGYTLRVQGTNRAGRFSPHEIRMPVTVLPAFHQTAGFRALVAIAVLAVAYAGYRLRVRRLEARGRELEQVVRERTLELREAYARIEEASLTDPLTRLRNRRFLEQAIAADLELATRQHGDLVFFLLDLDHFKSVNDTYGHAAGDAVLVQTAAVLRSAFRVSDHVVRWGGEEFLVVARFVDRADAPALAEKIRAGIAAHEFRIDDGTVLERTCSIGFAAWPFSREQPRAIGWEEIVDLADLGLYAAKRSGRNRWVGLEAGRSGDLEAAVKRFREDPESSLARGEVRVHAHGADVRWA